MATTRQIQHNTAQHNNSDDSINSASIFVTTHYTKDSNFIFGFAMSVTQYFKRFKKQLSESLAILDEMVPVVIHDVPVA